MKQFVWEIMGDYANGKIIVISESIDDCLKKLKMQRFDLWKDVQNGFCCYRYKESFKKFILEKSDTDLIKKEIDQYRNSVIQDKRNDSVCKDWHVNASDLDLLNKRVYYFFYLFEDEFIEQNIVDNKTPWFAEPVVYDIENILYFECVN